MAHKDHNFIDVKQDKTHLGEMLKLTKGKRKVPVIVQRGKIVIGYGGT
jgi:glutaredoxin 3